MIKKILLLFLLFVNLNAGAKIKYVFYFIGDGMGTNHILLTEKYISRMRGKDGRIPLRMSSFPNVGLVATHSNSNDITDSSAAGTALATGKKTNNGRLGIDEKGREVQSIADSLHKNGWHVGIATSVSIDHATPASFYAHVKSRKDYYTIGKQLAASNYEFFAGSPFLQPIPPENAKDDPKNNLYDLCRKNGYTFAYGYTDALTKIDKKKIILLPANVDQKDKTSTSMQKIPYSIDKNRKDLNLSQMMDIAIRKMGNNRFFLMVEGGAIDWASHANDAKTVILDMLEFNDAINVAYKFYESHKDETLIIVTADHETGGLALGKDNKNFLYLTQLQHQATSSEVLANQIKMTVESAGKRCTWEQVKAVLKKNLGLFDYVPVEEAEEKELQKSFELFKKAKSSSSDILYSNIDQLTHDAIILLNAKAHIGWTTTGHSGAFVPIFSIGRGSEIFSGVMDNSDIIPKLHQLVK